MRAKGLTVSLLLLGGCPADPPSDDPPETSDGSSAVTEDSATGTPTSTSGPSTQTGTDDSGTDGTTTTAETTADDTSDSSTTEAPPVGTPGCDVLQPPEDGEHQFMLDGYDRRYILRLPENYSSDQPWPLIFALHGNGGNPGYWDTIGGDRDIRTAFANEAILIIPEAINNAWRDYNMPPETWPDGIELELNYFDTIYAQAQNELCLDVDNVFSMGFSGGGSFSGLLGCRRDYIRAIAVGGSVIYFDQEEQCDSEPAAWITIGEGELTQGREDFRDFFATLGGCQDTTTPYEPEGCVAYDACAPDTPVVYCSHPGDHVWPSIGTDATKAFFQGFYQG